MTSFNPYERAILHDRITYKIEIWTEEDAADFRKSAISNPDGTVEWRQFVFDGWRDVLGEIACRCETYTGLGRLKRTIA